MDKHLRIGIDARNFISPMTGISRYIHEMAFELLELDCSVVLYLPQETAISLSDLRGVCVRTHGMPGPLLRQIWSHTVLPSQVREDRLDVFWGPAHRLPPLLPSNLARVLTVHDLVWMRAPQTMRMRTRVADWAFMRQSAYRSDIVVTVSEATAVDLREVMPDIAKPVVTIPAGVRVKQITNPDVTLAELGVQKPFVLFVGTLEPRKNLKRLLEAWRFLPDLRSSWRLVIAGGKGWGIRNLQEEIDVRGLAECVHLTGYVSDSQLDALFAGASLLAMPSLYEGFGLPIVEANARGVPALTSNLASMPEIAGPDAILVNPYSVASIAEGLNRVLSGELDRDALSSSARVNAARFDWRKSAHELINVFERAIALRKIG